MTSTGSFDRPLTWVLALPHPSWGLEPEPVVWIDVSKFDQAWRSTGQWIGPGGDGAQDNRYSRFGDWVSKVMPIEMCEVCIIGDAMEFTNGRHRFAWLRDHGLCSMPVQINADDAGELAARCGTDYRHSTLLL